MKEEKRKKIITKTFKELYNAFYYLYKYKGNDILYNGDDGNEGTETDCFGHYFEYNGRKYAVNAGPPEDYGYTPYKPENCCAICVYRFISNKVFAYENADASIQFSFNLKTEKLSEVFEIERKGSDWSLQATFEECDNISIEQIEIDGEASFNYITEGFCVEKNNAYLRRFYIEYDFYQEFLNKFIKNIN